MVIQKYNLNETPSKKEEKIKAVPIMASNPKPKKRNLKWLMYLWLVVGILAVFSYTGKLVNEWFDANRFVFPQFLEIKIQFPYVEKRQPITTISPIVKEIEKAEQDHLTEIERKIVNKWGERYGYIALAIFRCESGLNPLAVNWSSKDIGIAQINWKTWEKEVYEVFGYTIVDMFDVDKNLEVAYWISDRDLDGNNIDFTPWVVFNNGTFRGCIK
jgi:soluble lytic murein transglycosylase-like protein